MQSVLPQFQNPNTQAAEEERRKRKDLPCSRLASEMILEGMSADEEHMLFGYDWKMVALAALALVALLVGFWHMMGRGGGNKAGDAVTLSDAGSEALPQPQLPSTSAIYSATPALKNASSSAEAGGQQTFAPYFF